MPKKPLHILFLASWYPSENHATMGNFVQRHAEAVAAFHKVCVVAAFPGQREGIEIEEKGNLCEIRVYFKKKFPVLSHDKAYRKGIREAYRIFTHFDLAHVHVAYPAGRVATELDIPYLITEHFSGYQKDVAFKWGRLRTKAVLRILNKAQMLLPVSAHLGKALHEFGTKAPCEAVPNVVDTSVFCPANNYRNPKQSGRFIFLHISTLEERSKNITGILKAFKMLEEKGQDFLLRIGGDGDLDELRQKIKSFGPSPERVEVFGEKTIEEVADLMRQSHCLAMFSHYENQPCTILEALCCGVPVVSSAVGGIAEVIDEKSGLLVEAENGEAFALALEKMILNAQAYPATEIAAWARSRFSYQAVGQKISDIYLSVLSSGA